MFNIFNIPNIQDLTSLQNEHKNFNLGIAFTVGIFVDFLLWMMSGYSSNGEFSFFVFALNLFMITWLVSYALGLVNPGIRVLTSDEYTSFLNACKVTPQGREYIKKLNSMNRDYYTYDYDLIKTWNLPDTRANYDAFNELKRM